MANNDPKLSSSDITGQDPGKVGLKGILKSGAQAHALRPAAMDGFQVADFHRDHSQKVRQDDAEQREIRRLEGELAQSKSEIARLQDTIAKETKKAHGEGLQEGHFKGLEEGEKNAEAIWMAQIEVIRKDTAEVLENLALQHSESAAALRGAAVELALGFCTRLFMEEVQHNPAVLTRVISEAFEYLGQEERLRLRVNPLDLTLAEKGGSFWRPLSSAVQAMEVVADARIERGGCLLESEKGGTIDMRVHTLLANMEAHVRAAYSQLCASEAVPASAEAPLEENPAPQTKPGK